MFFTPRLERYRRGVDLHAAVGRKLRVFVDPY